MSAPASVSTDSTLLLEESLCGVVGVQGKATYATKTAFAAALELDRKTVATTCRQIFSSRPSSPRPLRSTQIPSWRLVRSFNGGE